MLKNHRESLSATDSLLSEN